METCVMNTKQARAIFRWLTALAVTTVLTAGTVMAPPAVAQDQDPAPAKYRGAVQLQNDDLFQPPTDAWKQFIKDYPNHRLPPFANFNLGACSMPPNNPRAPGSPFQHPFQTAPKDSN